ncbi:hypothetical protein J437_LFUL012908 [Ladona fulva]|uniref:Uncharacterized protein n=1 Tax=Ladona fulva TaxID=123851 RepID=A0A8K0KI69_LADFU|nr:hypothetical protein J437_LFUL012908 [Ladona fulva]
MKKDEFRVWNTVIARQGDPQSPILINSVLEKAERTISMIPGKNIYDRFVATLAIQMLCITAPINAKQESKWETKANDLQSLDADKTYRKKVQDLGKESAEKNYLDKLRKGTFEE